MIAMAIYHFSVKIISRSRGSSAVAAAAYRSASRLRDDRLGRTHNFSKKTGVVHSEVILPENAPAVWRNRERLWNDVETVEIRRDAQLAREVVFVIPRELDQAQGIELARQFVHREFVNHGMVADLNVHWDLDASSDANPHAHIMLSTREASENGFRYKVREWNHVELLTRWREAWADDVNVRLAQLDIDARVDHRSLKARGIDLKPHVKIGGAALQMAARGIRADRVEEHRVIARDNGERILRNPRLALNLISHQQATFANRDLAIMAHRYSDGAEQFNAVMSAMRNSPDLVKLGTDGRGEDRFTTREMVETEQRLERAGGIMAERERHRVAERFQSSALDRAVERELRLSCEEADALEHIAAGPDLAIVIARRWAGRSAMLGIAREAWEAAGYSVRGATLSGIAAESLESSSGITSCRLATLEHQWRRGRELLTDRDVLVIDEADLIGIHEMERVISHAADVCAKVVLLGDPEHLQAIQAGAAFRALNELYGGVEIAEVRRQRADWQRNATRQLATGRTAQALAAYRDHDMVHESATRKKARGDLIDRWDCDRRANPDASRIILAHTNAEVRALNDIARERMRKNGELGDEVEVHVARGGRGFAPGDRMIFLRNQDGLQVKNGTRGTVHRLSANAMTVHVDNGGDVSFELKDYNDIDHGYAATMHTAQGMTFDRVYVLATPEMDRHRAYLALSRHRDRVDLHYGRDDFADHDRLARTLSRERGRDMASKYEPPSPERAFAERRGIRVREGVAKAILHIPKPTRDVTRTSLSKVLERLRFVFGASPELTARGEVERQGRLKCRQPNVERRADSKPATLQARSDALKRDDRAMDAVFTATGAQGRAKPERRREPADTLREFEAAQPHAWREAEAAYTPNPSLSAEAVDGRFNRAARTPQAETEVCTNSDKRADLFIKGWRRLDKESQRQYQAGDMASYKASRAAMGEMATRLMRDPQLESLLASRTAELGIVMKTGRSLGAELAFNHSIDIGLGRSRGL